MTPGEFTKPNTARVARLRPPPLERSPMKLEIPQIRSNERDHVVNIKDTMRLPAETPWGNLTLKALKIAQRINHINRRIRDVYQSFSDVYSEKFGAVEEHWHLTEELMYWMRKTVDEYIQLLFIADYRSENDGQFPNKIAIDSIGSLLRKSDSHLFKMFAGHHAKLKQMNDVTNAYKHSFLSTDHNMIGRDEPVVISLSVSQNNLDKPLEYNSISLADFVSHMDELTQFMKQKTEELFSENRGEQGEPLKP
jgi:hypothetical protein